MLTIPEYTANILACYGRVTETEFWAGWQWYNLANEICQDLASEFSIPLDTVIDVISALSPRCNWEIMLEVARKVLANYTRGEYFPPEGRIFVKNVLRAYDRLDGTPIRGDKVTRFAENIRDPEYSEVVTVDSWARLVAYGDSKPTGKTMHTPEYLKIQAAYQAAGASLGIPAHKLQAICWVHVRE